MNKQNLWFLTLFSLILVLGIYYVTMPNELLLGSSNKTKKVSNNVQTEKKVTVKSSSTLEAMRVSLEEQRKEAISTLQEQLTSDKMTADEKNNAYEQLKYLNQLQGKEESFEKTIKEKYNIDCFIKIDNKNIGAVCISPKHDNILANNIMRSIQEQYEEKMYISVKFEKK